MSIYTIVLLIVIFGLSLHLFFYWLFGSSGTWVKKEHQQLDHFLPAYDFFEWHSVAIQAKPEKVYEAIRQFDVNKSKVSKFLLALRSVFQVFKSKKNRGDTESTADNQTSNFQLFKSKNNSGNIESTTDNQISKIMFILDDVENQEVVLGFIGMFWHIKPTTVQLSSPAEFVEFDKPGYCKAAWNLYIESNNEDTVTLSTETRILCLGSGAKALFLLYWSIIKPYSGFIRIDMLKIIKHEAEST